MELKAFKGMPHEFGGIDYTEGSEVEGGEFAVQIGKSGNEYIFDKNSSEGERLSKEYKRLDKNGRLTEDDPLALEAFDQMAREEALKHAQRSVNEKGIDPFRNMYDQAGQAANGGVKYAAGGAKDMYFGGGLMALMPGGMIDAGTSNEGLMKNIGEVTNLGNGGVNKYATGGYNPITTGVDPFSNYAMDPLQMQNQPSSSEISGGYELFQDNGSSFINNLTGSTTNNSINLSPQDNLSYNTSQQFNGLTDSLQTDPMTPMPTMKSYQLPVEPLPEMPTADASYNVTSGINDSIGGSQDGTFKDAMGNVQKVLQTGGDAIQALTSETKQGSDWKIAEKGNTRQRSIAPKYAYSTGAEMLGAAMSGAGQGAQMGKIAGPYGQAIGAAAGMVIGPMMKGLQDERAARQLDLAFKSELAKKNAEERLDEQIKAIGRDVDYRGKIDKDRYAGLNQLGTSSKEGGALPKNKKPIYGYYANGGGSGSVADQIEEIRNQREIETLSSGITYQDLQGGRSYPVYDDMGNIIENRRNIGASSLSPGFDIIQENPKLSTEVEPQFNDKVRMAEMSAQPLSRQSVPQYYASAQDPCDPCGKNDLNQVFGLYDNNKPIKYAQKGYDYNFLSETTPSETTTAIPSGNYDNPDIRPTSTLINNETGESYQFQNGGGKKKDEAVTGVAVTPTGAAYSSDQMSLDNRGVGSSDFGIIPANLEQYFYTLLGGNKQFTEKDMTPEEYETLVKLYNLRKEPNTIGYGDHNKLGSTDIAKAGMLTKLTNEPDIIRSLIGKAAVKDGYLTSDYNFGNTSFLEILKNPKKRNLENFMGWLHNNSPLVDSEAMAKKDAIKIKMPN